MRDRGKLVIKSILIISHFYFWRSILWAIPPAFWCNSWLVRNSGTKQQTPEYTPSFYLPIDSWVTIHLFGNWMDRLSGTMSFLNDSLLNFIHIGYTQSTLIPQYTIFPLSKSHNFLRLNICLQFKKNRVLILFIFHFRL